MAKKKKKKKNETSTENLVVLINIKEIVLYIGKLRRQITNKSKEI